MRPDAAKPHTRGGLRRQRKGEQGRKAAPSVPRQAIEKNRECKCVEYENAYNDFIVIFRPACHYSSEHVADVTSLSALAAFRFLLFLEIKHEPL
jgi:hypothetical protein